MTSPPARSPAGLVAAALVAASALALASCSGGGASGKPAASAVWLAPGEALAQTTASALAGAGIGEVYVEAGRIDSVGATARFVAAPATQLPRRTVATLAVGGTVPDEVAAADLDGVVAALREVAAGREGAGWVLRGVHLDVGGSIAALCALAQALEDELGDELLVSATISPGQLADPELEELLDTTDFIVVFGYGQRPDDATDDPASWDLEAVGRVVEQLETLGEPYQLGVATLGAVTVDAGGPPEVTTAVDSARDVLLHPRLELRPGFTLAGIDRQVYLLRAGRATQLGGLSIPAGADLRLHRLATVHVQRLRAMLAARDLEHHLGELYYRLPRAGEGLALSAANLVAATRMQPARPQPRVELELLSRRAGSWTLRARLTNESEEESDLSALDGNYVELVVEGGWWSAANPGQFRRAQLFGRSSNGKLEPTFRSPEVLRLYHPLLLGGDRVESGELRLVVGKGTSLTVGAEFVLPDGEMLQVPAVGWTPP